MRSQIIQLIQSLQPGDEIEEHHIQDVLSWLVSHAEIFRLKKPATPPKHLVSYVVAFDPQQKEILLGEHIRSGLWLPTGGHVEIDEHPKETAKREAFEELGIVAEFLFDVPVFLSVTSTSGADEPHTDVSLWYVIRATRSNSFQYCEKEFKSLRWFKFNDVPHPHTDKHMQRFINKLRQLIAA